MVMPRSSTAGREAEPFSLPAASAAAGGLLLDVEMTHSPETLQFSGGFGPCRQVAGRSRAYPQAAAACGYARSRNPYRLPFRARELLPVHRHSRRTGSGGHGVSLTLILPSMMSFLALSMSLWMSSMKPPEVASETPSSFRSKAVVPFIGFLSSTLLIRS